MKSFTFVAAALLAPVLAAPTAVPITKLPGPTKDNSYVIKLKDGVSKDSHIAQLLQFMGSQSQQNCKVVYKYEDVFQGYSGILEGSVLDYVRQSSDVEYIQTDVIYTIDWEQGDESLASREVHTQEATPRLAGRGANGEGVDIYGIDTGILTTHTAFGGRATWGATFGGFADKDGNGHGTHTAATAAGEGFGLATAAKVIAVKVCSDAGQCASSDIIAGVNYVVTQAKASGRPSIATMSLGGDTDTALDAAVTAAINAGVHCTVAAGNDNKDASTSSPAHVAAANTIGAIDSSNKKASFSNYGSVVDVWALGVNVLSAWIGSNTATNTISGTSMATPQVAGILAVVLGEEGQMDPAKLSTELKSHAKPVVIGAPSGTTNLKAQVW